MISFNKDSKAIRMMKALPSHKTTSSAHPHTKMFTPNCICKDCDNLVMLHKGTYYSLCEKCLKEKKLGPFKVRGEVKDAYSNLFWASDWQNKTASQERALPLPFGRSCLEGNCNETETE